MLARTRALLAMRGYDEVKYRGRRLAARPQPYFMENRLQPWQLRFKEMGPRFSKVWVALGGRMRRRRIGRAVDLKDLRYYWRPIEPQYQRLYRSKLRFRDRTNRRRFPTGLRPAGNAELGQVTAKVEYEKAGPRMYGPRLAPPRALDFEFRVL